MGLKDDVKNLAKDLFDVTHKVDIKVFLKPDNPVRKKLNDSGEPFDPRKYHRAFVSGLMGMGGAMPLAMFSIVEGDIGKGIGGLILGFFIPFAATLGSEYSIKPQE